MKYSDDTDERRKANIDYVNQRWTQLYELSREAVTDGIKYLFLVNAGAAVAVLAFFGSVPAVRDMVWPKIMLFFFVVGLILIGVLHIITNVRMSYLFNHWRNLVNDYFTDQKDWNEIVFADNEKSGRFKLTGFTAYASFACFVTGAIIGMVNFSSLNSGESNVRKETVTAPAKTGSTDNQASSAVSQPAASKTQ